MADTETDTLIERVRQLEVEKWTTTKPHEDHAAYWRSLTPTEILCIVLEQKIDRLEAEAKHSSHETH